MKNIIITLSIAAVLLVGSAFGQTILTNTTLSSAVTSSSTTTIAVTSATGINAPSASDNTKATFIYVDRELMDVRGVNGTILSVVRGAEGTSASAHASSAFVFVLPAYLATYMVGEVPPTQSGGSCTRGNILALPKVNFITGVISDCLGGQWHSGNAVTQTTYKQPTAIQIPPTGGTIYTSINTNGTAPGAATEQYCTELDILEPMVMTGLGVLNGTTVGTDKHLVILYDSSGNVLANSATAGATTSGGSTYQKEDFTAKYFAVGPARYFGCVQTNGTTDTIRMAITSVNDYLIAGKVTGQTFGTVAAVTLPTSFTTALGPYFIVY